MATWGPTTVPRPGRTWVSESADADYLQRRQEIAANESDEFEVIEREKARKAS